MSHHRQSAWRIHHKGYARVNGKDKGLDHQPDLVEPLLRGFKRFLPICTAAWVVDRPMQVGVLIALSHADSPTKGGKHALLCQNGQNNPVYICNTRPLTLSKSICPSG